VTFELRIDRPQRRNALDVATVERLRRELDAAAADETIRAIVVSGGGEAAFCAGQDVKELAALDRPGRLAAHAGGQALMDELEAHPCLVIAAIEGFCLGGGLELALACDARVAGEGATFGLPEVGRDLLPTWGGHHRLSRVVGLGRAKEIVLLGRRLDVAEAVAWGLIARAVPTGSAREFALALAGSSVDGSSRATLARSKSLLTSGFLADARQARDADALAEADQT
jgi:enoyl-CoA hydratase/carnithine racemase